VLETFQTTNGVILLQCVDDLLILGIEESEVRETTNKLLDFLGERGLRISRSKLPYVEREVRYLGHLIAEGKQKITPERIQGIVQLPLPRTKKELRKFL
ncbi:POL2 protein, partial [Podargus strigoides]|nr:POL2 protein [Podargus strigoides]